MAIPPAMIAAKLVQVVVAPVAGKAVLAIINISQELNRRAETQFGAQGPAPNTYRFGAGPNTSASSNQNSFLSLKTPKPRPTQVNVDNLNPNQSGYKPGGSKP